MQLGTNAMPKSHAWQSNSFLWLHLFRKWTHKISFSESSDEEKEDDDVGMASTVGASESEDNWDQLSEMLAESDDEEDDQRTNTPLSKSK